MRPSFDACGLATALVWSKRSADPKFQVGCAILDHHHRVVGIGYNGRPVGEPNERESMEHEKSGFIHAEVNALLAANWNGEQHTLYCTHQPCAACAGLIINTQRIVRVVYLEAYEETGRIAAGLPTGIELLRRRGIEVQHGTNSLTG